jgi:hypothetical protein
MRNNVDDRGMYIAPCAEGYTLRIATKNGRKKFCFEARGAPSPSNERDFIAQAPKRACGDFFRYAKPVDGEGVWGELKWSGHIAIGPSPFITGLTLHHGDANCTDDAFN